MILLGVVGALTAPQVWGEEPAAGKQVELELKIGEGQTIRYLLYLPKQYGSKEGKWPCMLFLHGRGESQGPLQTVAKWGPPRLLARGDELPFIVVSPQCPPSPDSWGQPKQQELLLALLDHVVKTLKVDEDRIYLTGLSMGGFGSWRLAADHPEKFAAVVPICGGGNTADAGKLKSLPIWVFHGGADPTVPIKRSEEMVEAIKAAGSTTIRFTTLEHIGHNSWEAAYASPDLYQWLDKQSAAKNRAAATRTGTGQ
jgi:predicted peptidase